MKALVIILGIFTVNAFSVIFAQQSTDKIPNIAVFSPMYLDSAFSNSGYKHGKVIPSYAVAGVEYYYGAKKAMDSINAEKNYCNYYVFDSKSKLKPIQTLIDNDELANMDLIIGSVSGSDVKLLADYTLTKNIPFISATFPNDAGVTSNPNFVILNSTLGSLCEKLHAFIAEKVVDQRIVFFTKEGKQEERIKNYFKKQDSIKSYTGIEYVDLGKDISEAAILKNIDKEAIATYVIGSNDVSFAKAVAKTIAKNKLNDKSYMMGLATWDNYSDLENKDFNGIYFYYTAPLTHSSSAIATQIGNSFKIKYDAKPGDFVYRGFESVYKYTKLLLQYGKVNFLKNITTTDFNTIHNYDIKAVNLTDPTNIDYYENKKIHIIKIYNGERANLNY